MKRQWGSSFLGLCDVKWLVKVAETERSSNERVAATMAIVTRGAWWCRCLQPKTAYILE